MPGPGDPGRLGRVWGLLTRQGDKPKLTESSVIPWGLPTVLWGLPTRLGQNPSRPVGFTDTELLEGL